jgi:electron-transferring-flavoprotein dehydrogenase
MNPQELLAQFGPRESMEYDVVITGAGPAGLATAICLKQLAKQNGQDVTVAVLEKGSEPGAHILSGAVMDPRALDEILPDWKNLGAPLEQPVTRDEFWLLQQEQGKKLPHALLPDCLRNEGNYVISLSNFTRWLAQQAESVGVEIFPGFTAAEILYGSQGEVIGVVTGNLGISKDGQPNAGFQLGMELKAKYTVFAEGSRGHLGKQLILRYRLDEGKDPQTYGLGIKELWEIEPSRHEPGLVVHTAGWPLTSTTYGGGFLYHLPNGQVTLGFITGLDYSNPWLSPFEEMQRWKLHPQIRRFLENGKRIGYGARAITAGGLLSLPKLCFPGGVLVGCDAGFLNVSRIKGSHAALCSGKLAAEALFDALKAQRQHDELLDYPQRFEKSWLYQELHQARNFKTWFKKGLWTATLMNGVEQWLLPKMGVATPPWTLHRKTSDHEALETVSESKPISYPKPDGKLTFDRLSSVFLSNTNHEENQPSHLTLKDASVPVSINLAHYGGPESRYCPAGVYEYVKTAEGLDKLQINSQNCVHCKTCDIKDPTQNIVWVTPEGGGGPNYSGM